MMDLIKRVAVVVVLMAMLVGGGTLVTRSDIEYNRFILHFLVTYILLKDIK
jgi:hypothetical protein